MPKKSVVIQVSPTSVEVAVLAGGVCVAHTERGVTTVDAPAAACVESVRQAVADCVADLGARGLSGYVISSLPGSSVAVVDVPAAAGAAAGEPAAKLALFELAHYSLDEHPFACGTLSLDPTTAPTRHRHMIASCDQDANVQALMSLGGSAGVRVLGVIPADALEISAGVQIPVPADAMVSTSLWIGRRSSVLTCRVGGAVKFVRALSVGLDQISMSLCRPLRLTSDPGETREAKLTEREARELLLTVGIPTPESIFCPTRGIEGSSVLPALQPMIQRLAVEIKQSLRFGLTEEQRAGLTISVDGPGVGVARLPEIVAKQAGVKANAVASSGLNVSTQPGLSVRSSWHRIESCGVALIPWQEARRRDAARFGVAAWAGVAVAFAFIIVAGFWASKDLNQAKLRLERLNSPADSTLVKNESMAAKIEKLKTLTTAIEARIERTMGPVTDHGAVLRAVSNATPEGFAISRVEIASGDTGGTLLIAGLAGAFDEESFAGALRACCSKLGQWPVLRDIAIGTTGRVAPKSPGTLPGHRFELRAGVVTLPRGAMDAITDQPLVDATEKRENLP